jgi:hypothetical protein
MLRGARIWAYKYLSEPIIRWKTWHCRWWNLVFFMFLISIWAYSLSYLSHKKWKDKKNELENNECIFLKIKILIYEINLALIESTSLIWTKCKSKCTNLLWPKLTSLPHLLHNMIIPCFAIELEFLPKLHLNGHLFYWQLLGEK